jgi:hypothetical protein
MRLRNRITSKPNLGMGIKGREMFKFEKMPQDGILHLLQNGRSSYEDFQNVIPDVMKSLKTRDFPNFLLEIENLEQDEDYVDPDLAFSTLNDVKLWISKMAIVCPETVREQVEPVRQLISNYQIPAKIFDDRSDALEWLQKSVGTKRE